MTDAELTALAALAYPVEEINCFYCPACERMIWKTSKGYERSSFRVTGKFEVKK